MATPRHSTGITRLQKIMYLYKKNIMKTFLKFAAITLMVAGCFGCKQANHKSFEQIPSEICLESLQNCTMSASFTADDFKWMGGNLNLAVFSPVKYAAADVAAMEIGDTLKFNGEELVIEKIERTDNDVTVNGGIEEGGCWLVADQDGTYTSRSWDDHAVYTEIGKAEVALGSDFVIIDCGINPEDPVDTIKTDQKLYIENLQGPKRDFTVLNTTVTMKDDMLVEINRRWIP